MEFFDLIRKTLPAIIKVRRTRSVAKIVNRFRMPLSGDVPELGSKIKTFLMNSNIVLFTFYLLLCETYILFSRMKLIRSIRYLMNLMKISDQSLRERNHVRQNPYFLICCILLLNNMKVKHTSIYPTYIKYHSINI